MNNYRTLRKKFFLDSQNQFCKARLPNCMINATDVHHTKGRNENTLNVETWIPVCRSCHSYIHDVLSTEERKILNL